MQRQKIFVTAALLACSAHAFAEVFVTTDPIQGIIDNTGTFTACQNISVPDPITIASIEVETAITHTWVGDLTIRLQAPSGTQLTVMNRPGRTGAGPGHPPRFTANTPIRFSNVAPSGLSAETIGAGCASSQIVGLDCGPDNYLPDPAPTDTPLPGVGTDFDDFSAQNAQGTWTLCVADSATGDIGTLNSWALGVNDPVPVELMHFSIE